MYPGQVVRPSPGEVVTCIRSGQDGGPFIFEVELAPGTGGPPTHTHDEGDEHVEVLEGQVMFRINGENRLLRTGDALTLTPNDAHTFWNPSKTNSVRARVTHGARFERLIVQPSFTAIVMYISYVDPGASRPSQLFIRLAGRLIALFGRLRGVQMAGVEVVGETASGRAGPANR